MLQQNSFILDFHQDETDMKQLSLFVLASVLFPAITSAETVRFETTVGNFDVDLFSDVAPNTVDNFLNYVIDGDYDSTIVHRAIPGFVIQGGGFSTNLTGINTDPPVANEFDRSNVRGTIAMAKLASSPDSATSQWFINLTDNSRNLDNQNGGFTVFGEVVATDLGVIDAIADVTTYSFGGPFGDIPLSGYLGGTPTAAQMVVINRISIVPEPQSMAAVGMVMSLALIRRVRRRS